MKKQSESSQMRDHLFKQMERLNDPTANLDVEVKRSTALAKVATCIVNSHKQEVDFLRIANGRNGKQAPLKAIGPGKKTVVNG